MTVIICRLDLRRGGCGVKGCFFGGGRCGIVCLSLVYLGIIRLSLVRLGVYRLRRGILAFIAG